MIAGGVGKYGAREEKDDDEVTLLTFLRTLDETLGRGIGLSDSPTSSII